METIASNFSLINKSFSKMFYTLRRDHKMRIGYLDDAFFKSDFDRIYAYSKVYGNISRRELIVRFIQFFKARILELTKSYMPESQILVNSERYLAWLKIELVNITVNEIIYKKRSPENDSNDSFVVHTALLSLIDKEKEKEKGIESLENYSIEESTLEPFNHSFINNEQCDLAPNTEDQEWFVNNTPALDYSGIDDISEIGILSAVKETKKPEIHKVIDLYKNAKDFESLIQKVFKRIEKYPDFAQKKQNKNRWLLTSSLSDIGYYIRQIIHLEEVRDVCKNGKPKKTITIYVVLDSGQRIELIEFVRYLQRFVIINRKKKRGRFWPNN